MKKLNKYIMLFVAAFALASCVDDIVDTPTAESKAGEDVQFGLSLPDSRTVYGGEKNNTFPIYWSDNDKVQIYSPECATGRNDAEYGVTPVSGQSYAEKLTKTGDFGVQWGDNEKANFYSVYPSLNAQFSSSDVAVTATLHISNEQKSNLSAGKFTDMDNVVMYAQTNDVKAGNIVNLKYTPYSTVLSFTMGIKASNVGWGSAKVNSLTLTAPEGIAIAGDFNLKFNGTSVPTITEAGNNSNSIIVTFDRAPILSQSSQTITINVPVIPLSNVNIQGWTVEVNVTEGTNTESTTYTKTLASGALKAGMIHKIILPSIAPETAWSYNTDSWMTSLYDYTRIYLTELSLPGAWYAGAPTGDGYQSTQSISDLWDAGIRAFAVETKMVGGSWISANKTPDNIVVSGTGNNSDNKFATGTNSLHSTAGDNAKVYKPKVYGTTYLQDIFEDVIDAVKDNPEEFAVLVLSYADAGDSGRRYIDFGAWLDEIYDAYNALNATNYKAYVYQAAITPETTIGEVKGKLIIKINVDANIAMEGYIDSTTFKYNNNLPAMFSYTPFVSQLDSKYFEIPIYSKMHYMTWSDSATDYREFTTTTTTSDLWWCFSSANRTHADGDGTYVIPTYAQRKKALTKMMEYSDKIYDSFDNDTPSNVWFYFNVGGTESTDMSSGSATDASAFATKMNDWLLKVIQTKTNGGSYPDSSQIVESQPSPLGIVMFNQCTSTTGQSIVEAIIDMNNAFSLKRVPVEEGENGNMGVQ